MDEIFDHWDDNPMMKTDIYQSCNEVEFRDTTQRLVQSIGLDVHQTGGFAIGLEYFGEIDGVLTPIYYRFSPYAVNGGGENLGTLSRLMNAGIVCWDNPTSMIDFEYLATLAEMFTEEQKLTADLNTHTNVHALQQFSGDGPHVRPVVHFSSDVNRPLEEEGDLAEAWFRLMALSTRKYKPHEVSVDGMFGALRKLVWCGRKGYTEESYQQLVDEADCQGKEAPSVTSTDKFPAMVDFVRPDGVRIADGTRVRLGAYLAEGTTVMHEGFVNFNAGTLGNSMVEGRISAGVVVGDGSDIGGGASIMGTLSGGGQELISVGERCLLGANSGLGVSLGNDCIVEAGLYLTAGTKVTLPDGDIKTGRELSGVSNLLFRRNSLSGAVESLANDAEWGGLNEALHKN